MYLMFNETHGQSKMDNDLVGILRGLSAKRGILIFRQVPLGPVKRIGYLLPTLRFSVRLESVGHQAIAIVRKLAIKIYTNRLLLYMTRLCRQNFQHQKGKELMSLRNKAGERDSSRLLIKLQISCGGPMICKHTVCSFQ